MKKYRRKKNEGRKIEENRRNVGEINKGKGFFNIVFCLKKKGDVPPKVNIVNK